MLSINPLSYAQWTKIGLQLCFLTLMTIFFAVQEISNFMGSNLSVPELFPVLLESFSKSPWPMLVS